jgi:predicted ATPase
VLQDPDVGCLRYAAETLWYLGYPDQALSRLQAALDLARERSHPYSIMWTQNFAARFFVMCRDVQAVEECVEGYMALATEQEAAHMMAGATFQQGWTLAERGQVQEGMVQMRRGIEDRRAIGAKATIPHYHAVFAEVIGDKVGQTEEGLTVLAEALEFANTSGGRYYEAELNRLKGLLLLRQAVLDVSQAEVCFHQTLDIARGQHAKSWELRAAMSLSRLWQQ